MSTLQHLSRPFTVSYEVTSSCDLGCFFCAARLDEFRRPALATPDSTRVIDELIRNGVLSIFLTGGEPLCRSDIVELVKRCRDGGANTLVSTCGVGVDRKLAKALLHEGGLDEIQVSIHGIGPVHDRIVGVQGAFEDAMNAVSAFLSAGMRVTVAAVATRLNAHCLPALAREAANSGVQHFRAQRLMPHSIALLKMIPSKDSFLALARELRGVERSLPGLTVHLHSTPGLLDVPDIFEKRQASIVHPLTHTCSAGKTSMGVLSDGACVPCLELKDDEFLCGNLLRDGLSRVWGAAPMQRLRKAGPANYKGACADCELRWTCYSARCVALRLDGDLHGDDVSCYAQQEGPKQAEGAARLG